MLTIVSGINTEERSLVTNILEAGGLYIIKDAIELSANEDFNSLKEYEKIQLIQERPAEIFNERNICINLTSFVLKQLPEIYYYNLLLIESSRDNLLTDGNAKNNRLRSDIIFDLMKKRFVEEHIKNLKTWLKKKSNFNVIEINFNDIINNPVKAISNFDAELKLNLNISNCLNTLYPKINYILENKKV